MPAMLERPKKKLWGDNGFESTSRKKSHWQFADAIKHLLASEFTHPESVAATCRFEIQGPGSEGQNNTAWARAIRTRIQSFERPSSDWLGGNNGTWFSGNSEASADAILNCFDLSCNQVYACFGEPLRGVKYQLDLAEIVTTLRPDLLNADIMDAFLTRSKIS